MSDSFYFMLLLARSMQYINGLLLCFCTTSTSPTKYYIVFFNTSHQIDMSYSYCNLGPWRHLKPFCSKLTRKKVAFTWLIATIGRNTCPVTATIGFRCSPEPPLLGNACGIISAHCHGHQNGQGMWYICLLLLCLLLPWWPLGQYDVNTCLMVASSGFWGIHGHVPLGDVVCIAPAHHRGHWFGWQTRCICSSLLIFVINNNSS